MRLFIISCLLFASALAQTARRQAQTCKDNPNCCSAEKARETQIKNSENTCNDDKVKEQARYNAAIDKITDACTKAQEEATKTHEANLKRQEETCETECGRLTDEVNRLTSTISTTTEHNNEHIDYLSKLTATMLTMCSGESCSEGLEEEAVSAIMKNIPRSATMEDLHNAQNEIYKIKEAAVAAQATPSQTSFLVYGLGLTNVVIAAFAAQQHYYRKYVDA